MADQRVTEVVRICDATTLTQGLAVDASGRISVLGITNALPAGTNNIGDVDVLSIVPGTGATNLGKAEDGASADGDVGVGALAVRKATPANTSGTDGDYEFLQMSAGRLWTSTTVDAALPAGTNNIGDVDVLTVITGTGATNLGKAEDAGHTTGDTGVAIWGVRNDANAALSGTDLDYTPLAVDSAGNLQVDVLSGGGANSPTNPAWDITNLTTPVNLAAGAGGNADSADLPSKYLWAVCISSSVAWKGILGTNDNGSITNKMALFGNAGKTEFIRIPMGFIQAPAAGVGTQGWRVAFTNLDTSETADFYCSFAYADNAG